MQNLSQAAEFAHLCGISMVLQHFVDSTLAGVEEAKMQNQFTIGRL